MGNILAVTPADTTQLAIIAGVTLAILVSKWRDLMLVFFDEPYARSVGLPAQALKVMFFALLAASTLAPAPLGLSMRTPWAQLVQLRVVAGALALALSLGDIKRHML